MQSSWELELLNKTRDYLIVGTGFSGLWTAFFLKQNCPDLAIQLVDKEAFPKGASTRNAGFACFGSPSELLMNIESLGEEKALFWAAERWHGIQLIKKYFGNEIDFENCGGYELFEDDKIYIKCLNSLPELNAFFSQFTGRKSIYSIDNKGSSGLKNDFKYIIKNTEEGSLNSGKLLGALSGWLLRNGVEITRNVEFQSFEIINNEVLTQTSVGEFKSKHLCMAMNAFSPKEIGISPGRGQVLLTKPIEGLTLNGTFHLNNGYTYFRNVGNRVLLGGGRNIALQEETTDEYQITEQIQNYLENLLRERILPNQVVEIERRWAGIMGFTKSHEPICELKNAHVSVIAGMNGMGVALAPRLGQVLAGKLSYISE